MIIVKKQTNDDFNEFSKYVKTRSRKSIEDGNIGISLRQHLIRY